MVHSRIDKSQNSRMGDTPINKKSITIIGYALLLIERLKEFNLSYSSTTSLCG
jgi:hypothetical protein